MGEKLRRQGKLDEAVDKFKEALARDHPEWDCFRYLYRCFDQARKKEDAVAKLQELLAIDPNNVRALSNYGNIFYKQGKFEEAVIKFQERLTIDPEECLCFGSLCRYVTYATQIRGSSD